MTRLLEMGVPEYLVAGGLAAVLAQRLVRVCCPACGGRNAVGCRECSGGYRGRIGVFQLLVLDDPIRESIVRPGDGAGGSGLRRMAADAGMGSMTEDARRKVTRGVTTPHEVARVLRGDASSALPCPSCGGAAPSGADGCPACGHAFRRRCCCGRALETGWRFCAWCHRPV